MVDLGGSVAVYGDLPWVVPAATADASALAAVGSVGGGFCSLSWYGGEVFSCGGFFLGTTVGFPHLSHRHSHKPPHNHTPILPSLSAFLSFAFTPLSKLVTTPFCGPLFLSFPRWKLSQSATPFYLRGNAVVFCRKV